jgi:hypothetical protein
MLEPNPYAYAVLDAEPDPDVEPDPDAEPYAEPNPDMELDTDPYEVPDVELDPDVEPNRGTICGTGCGYETKTKSRTRSGCFQMSDPDPDIFIGWICQKTSGSASTPCYVT